MLVLSRGLDDKIVFPNLGISVEILRISGNRVRVGVDAPKEVRVLRHELAESLSNELQKTHEAAYGTDSHKFRNRLNTAHVALSLAEKQINAGLNDKALDTLRRAMSEFDQLDAALQPESTEDAKAADAESKPRALLVEDDQNESELLAGYLRMSGFEVDTAEDGLKAMVHLGKRDRPDVVLMDMHMPRMDGAHTIKSIRSDSSYDGMRVFAVTGSQPGEFSVPIGPGGVDDWFRKPIDPQKLVDKMHETLVADGAKSA